MVHACTSPKISARGNDLNKARSAKPGFIRLRTLCLSPSADGRAAARRLSQSAPLDQRKHVGLEKEPSAAAREKPAQLSAIHHLPDAIARQWWFK
jgi:hypothetical protein